MASVGAVLFFVLVGTISANDIYPYEFEYWSNIQSYSTQQPANTRRSGPADDAYDVFPSQNWNDSLRAPKAQLIVEHLRYSAASFGQSISANIFRVGNPKGYYSVVEPVGGCQSQSREYTSATSRQRSCLIATNAGFFDPRPSAPTYGKCLGNVVSHGKLIQKVQHKNVAFGMLKNGSFIVGMLNPDTVGDGSEFHTLVNGVVWLVRNNISYVAQSLKQEDESTQYTSSLRDFATVVSARNAIGYDAAGRLVLVTIDGKTWSTRGINLYEFAEFLISLGVVNAINLDGGGSATAVVNGTVVSMPSDPCPYPNENFSCERRITTVNCIYANREFDVVVSVELKSELGWMYVWLVLLSAVALVLLAYRSLCHKKRLLASGIMSV